jgi:hypothetical protein
MAEEETTTKPVIKVKGRKQDLTKKARNPKPKNSTFFLTINTNQQYKDGDQNLANDLEVFEGSIQEILNHINDYVHIKVEGDTWDDKVVDVDIDYVVEHGLKKGQIHTHILFKFKHNTKLLLDYDKIKNKLKDDLGISVYLYNRMVQGSNTITDYMEKYT